MEGISPFQSGRPLLSEITADKLNRILAEIKRNRPVVAAPLSARVTGDGTHISLGKLPSGGTSAPAADNHPFQIASAQDPDNENQYLVTVRPGTANNIIAANHFNGAQLEKFSLAKDQFGYAVLTASTNGKEITSTTLGIETTAPAGQTASLFSLPTEVKFTLGVIYNSSVYQIVTNNILVSGKIVYTKDKSVPAAPGELPFEIWYHWQ
jgi:hypothetical protein